MNNKALSSLTILIVIIVTALVVIAGVVIKQQHALQQWCEQKGGVLFSVSNTSICIKQESVITP